MKQLRLIQVVVAVSFALLTGAVAPPLLACATVTTIAAPVFVQSENAVIIWDSAHQTEQFIRQAKISTDSPDLGFLVPTPESPEVAEADPKIFELVSNIGSPMTQAPEVTKTPWQVLAPVAAGPAIQRVIEGGAAPVFGIPRANSPNTPPATPAPIAERDVAGYHVTTLDPVDTAAITAWLVKNGYVSTPALQAWLKGYANAGWRINAFRLNKVEPGSSSLTTRAIRLSFHTAQPYYPYSEPADRQQAAAASPGGRVLHVAVLSDHRMAGAKPDATNWPGQLQYAGPSTSADLPANDMPWLQMAKLNDAGHNVSPLRELTSFIDHANPRPGAADLYFTDDKNAAPFRATVIDHTLPTVVKLDWTNPIADAATLVAVILIPGVPLYLGWFIYSRARAAKERMAAGHVPFPQTRVFGLRQKIMGMLGIVWGFFYGLVLTYNVVVWLFGKLGSTLAPGSSSGAVTLLLDGVGILAALAMVGGVVYCGVQAWRSRPSSPSPEAARQLALKRKLQESYALAALFAGAVGLALMVYFVVQLTV